MKKVGSIVITDKLLEEAMKRRAEGSTYTGAGDNILDFGSASSFVDEEQSAKRVNIVLENKGDVAADIQFNEIIEAVAGAVVLKEGTVAENLTAKGSPRTCDVLTKFVNMCPTRVLSIKLNASDATQLDYPIRYRLENPWTKNSSEVERIPSNYQSQDTNNPNMVEVKDINDWMLSNLSTIIYTVGAHQKVTVSILFGASVNLVSGLKNKAYDAALTVTSAFAAQQG